MEVSSPGLLRPFKKPKDYQRNLGEYVEVKLFAPITFEQKGKKFTDKEFIGILKGYNDGDVTITIGGEDKIFEKAEVANVRLRIV